MLSFLVTNRSIATDDFVRDEAAAAATSDTIARFLSIELATLPIASSASGFIYRVDPAIGAVARLTDSFGPFFVERPLTTGKNRGSLSVNYRSATFDNIDGRNLRDGTLVSTASVLRGTADPFDVETVSLRIHMDTITVAGSYGATDRLELGAAVPFVRLTLSGERVDTYRGRQLLQATGKGSASGLGDVVVRAKYNLLQTSHGSIAVAAETRLATGSEEQLLGAGQSSAKPRLLVSVEQGRATLHGDVGYSFGGLTREFDYAAAATFAAAPSLTLIAEISGRQLDQLGRLVADTEPHPRLLGVDTIRLTGVPETTNRVLAIAGLKWNVARTWVVGANVVRPLTTVGLNARWVPAVTVDYAFGH
ncbi:MAG TPA: transporter [Vicinamibacterales bacterium]|nr:transporter [Vicinamibacterales bacterium]